jgi:hypothetical protein
VAAAARVGATNPKLHCSAPVAKSKGVPILVIESPYPVCAIFVQAYSTPCLAQPLEN